jgi:hypothetical protein
MSVQERTSAQDKAIEQDVELLKKYGLRWSVLAAWRDALELRRVAVAPETDRTLEKARIKLASGCFNVCEVGCDLQTVEGGAHLRGLFDRPPLGGFLGGSARPLHVRHGCD